MLRLIPVLLLTGCSMKHYFSKHVLPSESACIDGTIINIEEHGCKSFYWGIEDFVIKIRCTYSPNENWWTQSAFYAVPVQKETPVNAGWRPHCSDNFFNMFAAEPGIKLETTDVHDVGSDCNGC